MVDGPGKRTLTDPLPRGGGPAGRRRPRTWAQIYLAEAAQYVSVFGADGQASLLADAAGHDVLAYGDPLRMLVGVKNILYPNDWTERVARRGVDVLYPQLA
jgi:hypothetical protein